VVSDAAPLNFQPPCGPAPGAQPPASAAMCRSSGAAQGHVAPPFTRSTCAAARTGSSRVARQDHGEPASLPRRSRAVSRHGGCRRRSAWVAIRLRQCARVQRRLASSAANVESRIRMPCVGILQLQRVRSIRFACKAGRGAPPRFARQASPSESGHARHAHCGSMKNHTPRGRPREARPSG